MESLDARDPEGAEDQRHDEGRQDLPITVPGPIEPEMITNAVSATRTPRWP